MFGFGAFRNTWSDYEKLVYGTYLVIPDWFLVMAFTIMPLLWFRSHRRPFQSHDGYLCPACGYDLCATPDRCPECGDFPISDRKLGRAAKQLAYADPDSSQPTARARRAIAARKIFSGLSALSLLLALAMCVLWIRSYNAVATLPPPGPHIPLPMPVDVSEYLVPIRGTLQWWEYTPWRRSWYDINFSVPIWPAVVVFSIAPAGWLLTSRKRNPKG